MSLLLIDQKGLRDQVREYFPKAYAVPNEDAHGLFAQLLGVGRSEAKQIAYEYMWSEPKLHLNMMVKNQMDDILSILRGYRVYMKQQDIEPLTTEEAMILGDENAKETD